MAYDCIYNAVQNSWDILEFLLKHLRILSKYFIRLYLYLGYNFLNT